MKYEYAHLEAAKKESKTPTWPAAS
jgi:hypothetical protein